MLRRLRNWIVARQAVQIALLQERLLLVEAERDELARQVERRCAPYWTAMDREGAA